MAVKRIIFTSFIYFFLSLVALADTTPAYVEVASVQAMDIPQQIYSVGNLVAFQSVTITSEIDGRILHVYLKDGQHVTDGTTIIELENAKAKADLTTAQTALALSKATYQRYLAIADQGGVSRQDLDQKRSDLESKAAAVNSAEAALAQTRIVAPFSGQLGEFKVSEGDYIKAGQPLVKLVNKRLLRVEYRVAEKYLPKIAEGQKVLVRSDSYPDQQFEGKVSFVAPAIDETTRSVSVQATIPNAKQHLSPGMFVHVNQQIAINKAALVIPQEAINASVEGDYVFRVNENVAEQVAVKVGLRFNGLVEIKSGLKLHDTIVTAGQQKISDGSKVTIVNKLSPTNGKHKEQ